MALVKDLGEVISAFGEDKKKRVAAVVSRGFVKVGGSQEDINLQFSIGLQNLK
jgi:hypothetical protein